jgi:hypothetical protein
MGLEAYFLFIGSPHNRKRPANRALGGKGAYKHGAFRMLTWRSRVARETSPSCIERESINRGRTLDRPAPTRVGHVLLPEGHGGAAYHYHADTLMRGD